MALDPEADDPGTMGSGGDRDVTFPCLPPVIIGLGLFTKMILEGTQGSSATQCPGPLCPEQGLE